MSEQPRVWSSFTKTQNGKELKMRIEEFPNEKFVEIFDFLFKFFVTDEPMHIAAKVAQNPEALEEYKAMFTMMSQEIHYQVDVCRLEEDEKIVGMSIMVIEKKGQSDDDLEAVKLMVKSEEIKTLLHLSEIMQQKCDVFEKLGVESSYKGRGVIVDKDYRRLGIAGELLKARSIVCKVQGIPVTSAWMTSVGTQIAASRLKWDTLEELRYSDLEKEAGVQFEDELILMKLMADRAT